MSVHVTNMHIQIHIHTVFTYLFVELRKSSFPPNLLLNLQVIVYFVCSPTNQQSLFLTRVWGTWIVSLVPLSDWHQVSYLFPLCSSPYLDSFGAGRAMRPRLVPAALSGPSTMVQTGVIIEKRQTEQNSGGRGAVAMGVLHKQACSWGQMCNRSHASTHVPALYITARRRKCVAAVRLCWAEHFSHPLVRVMS